MPFADTTQMLHAAQAGGYAVGAFNAENMEMAQAIWIMGTALNYAHRRCARGIPA